MRRSTRPHAPAPLRSFPKEPLLGIDAAKSTISLAAAAQIREAFKAGAGAEPAAAAELLQEGEAELAALRAILGNEAIDAFPGPPLVEKLHRLEAQHPK